MNSDTSANPGTRSLSLVIPLFNEEESLESLVAEIQEVGKAHQYELEIVFVDDGSSDTSWSVIQRVAATEPRIKASRFRTNFGKAAALAEGFERATGDIVITMDADLQDDPHEIPNFLAKLDEGYDLVSGWKRKRYDPWHKVLPSRVFNAMVSRLTGVHLHDHNCGMKAYRRQVTKEIVLYGELHRFTPSLSAMRGFRVSEMVLHHRARKFGHSKYGAKRFIKGFLDLITVAFRERFGQRPMHALGFAALVFWLVAIPLGFFANFGWAMLCAILGTQFFLTGLIAELQLSQRTSAAGTYSIAERIGS